MASAEDIMRRADRNHLRRYPVGGEDYSILAITRFASGRCLVCELQKQPADRIQAPLQCGYCHGLGRRQIDAVAYRRLASDILYEAYPNTAGLRNWMIPRIVDQMREIIGDFDPAELAETMRAFTGDTYVSYTAWPEIHQTACLLLAREVSHAA
jgi:hypothetical protein